MQTILAACVTVALAGCVTVPPPAPPGVTTESKFVEGPHSQRCTGVVEDLHDARYGYNDDPVVTLTLSVTPPQGPSYEARFDALVPHLFIPRRGDKLNVSCDPGNPANTKVINRDDDLDW